MPIQLRAKSTAYPLSSFDVKRSPWPASVSAYCLVPGMENSALTFKQKSQEFVHSSKVPTIGFTVETSYPAVIQLGNPTPIPFLVRIVPERIRTSEILQDVPQPAQLKSLELLLKADTMVIAPGMWQSHDGSDTVKYTIDLPVHMAGSISTTPQANSYENTAQDEREDGVTQESFRGDEKTTRGKTIPNNTTHNHNGSGSYFPTESPRTESSPEEPPPYTSSMNKPQAALYGPLLLPNSWGAEETPVDVGNAMCLRLHPTHATAFGRPISARFPAPIYPSFTTYCIKHSHRLKWKMVIQIAGKTVKVQGEHPITLLAPSQM